MSVIQREAPQSAIKGITQGREELEARYTPYFDERLSLRQFVTYVPNKQAPIHRWFQYKEGFSYKLVEMFLHEFDADPDKHRILDPFAGCGTTLVVAQQMGFGAWGIDILPVAVFVSRVKLRQASEYDMPQLKTAIEHLRQLPFHPPTGAAPQDVRIIHLAYDPDVLDQILFFKEQIQQVENIAIREFLLLGLMAVLEKVSYTSKDGQYLRLKRNKQIPPVRQVLIAQLEMMFGDLVGER
jgi:hypothetical protein